MLITTLITASILSANTFYPLTRIGNPKSNLSFRKNVVLYDRCLFYNNSCVLPINEIYPDLQRYNNLFIDDINMGLNNAIDKLLHLNNVTNYKVKKIHSNTVTVNLNSDYLSDITIILTPLHCALSRVFIFNNLPNYKKTLLYYNIKFIINKLKY
tara:strand:- start:493 stop:957 length:465 start_codon:yes stop_codon:yes gene_type:complete